MKYLFLLLCFIWHPGSAQDIQFKSALFSSGDNQAWKSESFADKDWKPIQLDTYWEKQGYENYDGFGWYRIHFYLPASVKTNAALKDKMEIYLQTVDDADITYLNGTEIGKTGRMPDNPGGYKSGGRMRARHYTFSSDLSALHWDQDNVLAVRVYDGGGSGGIFGTGHLLRFLNPVDYIKMDVNTAGFIQQTNAISKEIQFKNAYPKSLEGTLTTTVTLDDSLLKSFQQKLTLSPGINSVIIKDLPAVDAARVRFVFTEDIRKQNLQAEQEIPYILTPKEKETPHIHNADAFGCRPGVPFLLKIAATGIRPIRYHVSGLPEGLMLDAKTGIISGVVAKPGKYTVNVSVSNAKGKETKSINVLIGDNYVNLTPPMGWNSWNCWGLSVSDAKVKSSANALISSGLANHGWNYINIDDGWEAAKRAASGEILANEKFPDMKGLSDYLHTNGLKFGIYSSPGETTCGGYLGSYLEETRDANTYASWGVDYLKYDLCSYRKLYPSGLSLQQLQEPYIKMHKALQQSGRSILYSLCEYGMQEVWKWGNQVGGNIWRTTGDITDNWNSLKNIGFSQEVPASYNGPEYGFGDPDMLIVGYVGWGDNLHLTRLTPSEQYTHISLWSLLSAPLMLGCDLARIDPFTYNLLSNDEVLAIDQDIAGKGPKKTELPNNIQVWVKELADGSKAMGIFNLGDKMIKQDFSLKDIGFDGQYAIRDLWRQKQLKKGNDIQIRIPSHGVMLVKIKKVNL